MCIYVYVVGSLYFYLLYVSTAVSTVVRIVPSLSIGT